MHLSAKRFREHKNITRDGVIRKNKLALHADGGRDAADREPWVDDGLTAFDLCTRFVCAVLR